MTNNLDNMRARIRGLMAKTTTNGCTEAEAMMASTKVAELMDKYNFSMNDLEEREEIIESKYETIKADLGPVVYVATSIAKFCDVKVWKISSNVISKRGNVAKKTSLKYFGRTSDIELAKYMTDIISRAMKTSEKEWAKTMKNNYGEVSFSSRTQFQRGMAARISSRLLEMKEERNKAVHDNNQTGFSLVVVKNAEVEEAFNNLSLNLKNARRSTVKYTGAFYSGIDAGGKVNLNTGITGRGSNKVLAITSSSSARI